MKTVKANGISWFLDDDALIPVVQELIEQRGARRTYGTVTSGDQTWFAKYFFETGAWGFVRNRIDPRGKREYQTGKKLLSLSIATPNPVGYGLGCAGSFVLQEWIEARPLREAFTDRKLLSALLSALSDLLQKLRREGIAHNDLHLDNILVKDESLFLIDLHKTRIKKGVFTGAAELVNLVHALGPLYWGLSAGEKSGFFQMYGRPDIRFAFEKRLVEEQARWVERKKRRAFSTTSKLARIGRRVYIKGAEALGKESFVECIKSDRKVRVERHSDHIRKIYRNSRRLNKAWRNHVAIEYLELPAVPKPLYVQRGTLFANGFIAMEDLQGRGEELDRFLDRHYDALDARQTRRFVNSLAEYLSMLFRKGILHRDLKGCNIFVLEDGFRLLDVEDAVFHRYAEEDVLRMSVQLNTSVPGRINFSHRARFFLKIAGRLGFERPERKRLFVEAMRASASEAIVYEGVNGLRKETWTESSATDHR